MRYGGKGIAAFAIICLVVSNVIENIGVATGFPFGPYHYTDVLGPKLGYVPLMIGPAYLGVGYLSWVLATILVGDVKRGADAFQTFATPLIGAFIMVLWDLSMDPSASTVAQVVDLGAGRRLLRRAAVELSRLVLHRLRLHALFALYLRARATRATGTAAERLLPAGDRHVRASSVSTSSSTYLMKSGGENVDRRDRRHVAHAATFSRRRPSPRC